MSEYTRLVQELAQLAASVDEQIAEADGWLEQRRAAAKRAVDRAELAVRRAEEAVSAASRAVEVVDAEVGRLWREVTRRFSLRRPPDPPVPTPGSAAHPEALLDGVRELLDRARQPGTLPRVVYPLLALVGVLGATAAYLLALAARLSGDRYGGELALGMPVLGLVVALLGPVVGLAPAKVLADRRNAVLDAKAVAVVLVSGSAVTATLLTLGN